MSHKHCLNCGHSVHENFCARCGQKTDTHRIGWHYLWHDLPHSLFHLDKGFLYTAKELSLHPGKAIREFLDGKRVKHFRPLAYVLILGVIMSLGLFGQGGLEEAEARGEEIRTEQQDEQGVELNLGDGGSFEVNGSTINYVISRYYGLLVILCIPFYAFVAWLFYRKERNFVEIMTGFMFGYGHTTWFGVLLIIANLLDYEDVQYGLIYSWFSLTVLYLLWMNTTMFTRFRAIGRFFISIVVLAWGFCIAGIALIIGLFFYGQLTGH